MSAKVVQENLGDAVISAIVQFARKDIKTVAQIEDVLDHISNANKRYVIALAIYGARWIYKLQLVTLTSNEEQIAHVRAQISEYGSSCEAILLNMACDDGFKYSGIPKFYHVIRYCKSKRIINASLSNKLHTLRMWRNEIHMEIRTSPKYLDYSKQAYSILQEVIIQTRRWKSVPIKTL
ncbi:hypothetical protein [Nitratidesulfovibrio vulgaris]|uniref:hypothetical protein n=1 Tax=Nitratidesulfovibrio vulgaris TaxID=881 RepID=UPI0001E13B28|nr:hypothetical protein [Nitratidesulfovibrio vulgaris]